MSPKKEKKENSKKPPFLSPDVINALEVAFNLGAGDMEACFYAKISYREFKEYLKEHPDFQERREILKQRPLLEARQTLMKAIKEDPKMALEYLDRAAGKEP